MRKKGSVTVIAEKDRGLRLRWRYEGKQYSLALGLPDSRVNRAQAESKARMIEVDIQTGHFDPTLDKYRSRAQLERKREQSEVKALLKERLKEQFNPADKSVLSLLKQWGGSVDSPEDADSFIGWLRFTKKRSSSTVDRYLDVLRKVDPANFCHIKIKVEKKGLPRIYSKEELGDILRFLQGSKEYGYYFDLIRFYLLTACRTSEALALQWKHVEFETRQVQFYDSWGEREDGSLYRKRTKTEKPRPCRMGQELYDLLAARKGNASREDLVFPAKKGGVIKHRDLERRCWRACLSAAGIEHIPRETTIYRLRHTALTRALAMRVNPLDLAVQAGHDIEMLFEKYAGLWGEIEELPGIQSLLDEPTDSRLRS